jgi:hypothetical protein
MWGVTVLIVLILAALGLAAFAEQKGAAARKGAASPGPGSAPTPGKKGIHPYWFIGAVVLGIVLLRFGVSWIVVAGGMALAALRSLVPLIRFLPLLQSLRAGRSAAGAGPGFPPPGGGPTGAAHRQRMSRHEALQLFGLDEGASREDVQREYRRLMRKLHPDLGGSSYLAAKINEAKDVLS